MTSLTPACTHDRRDGRVFGACKLTYYREDDRRFWSICFFGDDSAREGAGFTPTYRAVMDDFGTLQPARSGS